jgi:ribonuclease BN (tRNA processing enzyme)
MKITVLGCSGAAFPGHSLPGFLIDEKILFDAGSLTNVLDVRAQLKIKNIFITHAHLDHVTGIPFLADNIIIRNIRHNVNILSIPSVIRTIKRNLLNSSVWPDFTAIPRVQEGILDLIELKIDQSIQVNGYIITPHKVKHSVPAVGYLVEDKNKRRLFYTGDTGPSDATWTKIRDKQLHCLIIDVSFPNRMEEIAFKAGHLTARLLEKELLKMGQKPERICITHLKPQFSKTIETELKKLRIKNLRLLKDREVFEV